MHVLITGASGQDSWYLQRLLGKLGVPFTLIGRQAPHNSVAINAQGQVTELIKAIKPSHIFHLAAQSSTRHEHLFRNHEAIVEGTTCILEACRTECPSARVFIAGSGLQFENLGQPIPENANFAATSAYACARIQSVYLGRYFREKFQLPVFVGYLFGHESPRRPDGFSSRMLVNAALEAQRDPTYQCEVGNAAVIREFGYAADIVLGMWQLCNQPLNDQTVWEANICTGVGLSLAQWAAIAFGLLGLDSAKHLRESQNFLPDYAALVGLPGRVSDVGWNAQVNAQSLCRLMLGMDDENNVLDRLYCNGQAANDQAMQR